MYNQIQASFCCKCNTPADFKSRTELGFIRLNEHSLRPKMGVIHTWLQSTDADVIVLESWLSISVLNKNISINDYNVCRMDQPIKNGLQSYQM